MTSEVERYDVADDEVAEAWERRCDDPAIGGVDATRPSAGGDWLWQVGTNAAEFIREDPLEPEFRRRVDAVLRSVAGVTAVAEEDREVWLVAGNPAGPDLVCAVAVVLDALAGDLEAAIEG